jgi:hypothetical protein
MVKLLVFAILLASSPATGLLETLFNAENSCYVGCHSQFTDKVSSPLDGCKKGCDFYLHKENCAVKCLSLPDVSQQSPCQVGCTLSQSAAGGAVADTIKEANNEPVAVAPAIPEPERPRSIILIRLRQRPSFDMPSLQMPSVQRVLTNDPIQFFNNIIKQFQEKANQFDETLRKSFEQNSKDLPKPEFGAISQLVKNLPVIRLPGNIRADSSSEESDDITDQRPLLAEFKDIFQNPRDHQQYLRERFHPANNRVQQFFTDVSSDWNDLVRKQPKIPVWIFLGILLSSSAILWYMVMSLCRHTPSRNALSIRAQELVFHPYDYEAYEKEKIQPDEQPYEVTESLPIKVKLSNI